MPARAIIGATLAAIVGALVWGGVAYATNYEVGYVAWGIGGLVGLTAAAMGGSGRTSATVCAVLALGAIFLGKMFAVQWSAPAQIRQALQANLSREVYEDAMKDAEDFAQVSSEQQHAAFMVQHGYTDADSAENVADDELAEFREHKVLRLKQLHEEKPDYEAWREDLIRHVTTVATGNAQTSRVVVETLGPMDILFALLGLATAWRLGNGGVLQT